MRLDRLELSGFKSFAKKVVLTFNSPIVAVVGPNGSGKSNIAESCRWVLGEQSFKSLRGRRGEDFIWHGSVARPRANYANVAITLDNQDKQFPLEAAEVVISREVARDGTNLYALNRSTVRLKELTELLHRASLGASGYHIISQGEVDKILTASPAERRQIIEIALGLRLYEWQLAETEKKLQKTGENLKQVELLRREIAPHLRFLKKEMEKIAATRNWRRELKQLSIEYFCVQQVYLALETKRLSAARQVNEAKLKELDVRLGQIESVAREGSIGSAGGREKLAEVETRRRQLFSEREDLTRRLGRLEGLLEAKQQVVAPVQRGPIDSSRVGAWVEGLEAVAEQVKDSSDLNLWRAAWAKLKQILALMKQATVSSATPAGGEPIDRINASSELEMEHESLTRKFQTVESEVVKLETELEAARRTLEAETVARGQTERALVKSKFELAAEQAKTQNLLSESERHKILQAEFERELAEVVVLTDRELLDQIKNDAGRGEPVSSELQRGEQDTRRRQIERLKMKLEETGVGSSDVAAEYEQVEARAAHLAREVSDLEASVSSLEKIIDELKQKIEKEFRDGLGKINRQFQTFFQLLFGGGRAELVLTINETADDVSAEDKTATGLEIAVILPHKRVRGLEMLSGGERSLTSIALLFALSRVHPPPFMILDETDAALDEANSHKYGDMVVELAKETQLILITHNRETMSRAGIIYGVTMGTDGASRLLSIKFDEAVSYAKT